MAVAKERLYTMVQLRIQRLYILAEKYSFKNSFTSRCPRHLCVFLEKQIVLKNTFSKKDHQVGETLAFVPPINSQWLIIPNPL